MSHWFFLEFLESALHWKSEYSSSSCCSITLSSLQVSSTFQSSLYTTLLLQKAYTLAPIFAKGKKSKEDFHFRQRGEKENTFSFWFCSSCYSRGSIHPTLHLPSRNNTRQAPSPGLASQHQATRALNCVCGHLCFISYFHLLARHVLR